MVRQTSSHGGGVIWSPAKYRLMASWLNWALCSAKLVNVKLIWVLNKY